MSATHRYLVADLVTDQPLGWLPLTGVSYSRRINVSGDINATVPITSTRVGDIVRFLANRPAALYCERKTRFGRSLWWGGIVWVANPSKPRRGPTTCALTGATFDSMPGHRFIWDDIDIDPPIDRCAVVEQLWDHMQSRPGNASIGVDVASTTIGGDTWAGSWAATESATYAKAIADVSSIEPAFETTVDVYTNPDGTRHRELRFGTPLLGDQTLTRLLATPANLATWSWSADHTARGTHGLARGASVGKAIGGDVIPLTSNIAVNQTMIDDGHPRVDVTADFDVDDDTLLDGHAAELVTSAPSRPSVTVRLPETSPWTPAALGGLGRVVLVDPVFPGGRLDTTARVIGVSVKPAERGSDEEVTFEFQPDEVAS